MKKYRIYMDVCCLNRPFDDLSQNRIYLETEAILAIISRCERSEWVLVSSGVIEYELSNMQDDERLRNVQTLLEIAHERINLTQQAEKLAAEFMHNGMKSFDSFHLALAETNGLDVFLTTDDRLLKAAAKTDLHITVSNPVTWIMEVEKNEQ